VGENQFTGFEEKTQRNSGGVLGPGSGPDVRCQHRAQKGHSDSIDHREINY